MSFQDSESELSQSPRSATTFSWSPTPFTQGARSVTSTPGPSKKILSKRVHYTDELKLLLIRRCLNNRERYLEASLEVPFWQYITALFKDTTGYQGADVRKKVTSMVGERKGNIESSKTLSGVAVRAISDLEQAIDEWIEVQDR